MWKQYLLTAVIAAATVALIVRVPALKSAVGL